MALTKVSTAVVDLSGNTGALEIAKGTTSERNAILSPTLGLLRANTTDNTMEVYTDNSGTPGWQVLAEGGGILPPLTVDYLVVGGGGAGQGVRGGGGGAGGLIATTTYGGSENAVTLSPSNYTFGVTIGTGGVGVQNAASYGANGGASTIGITGSTQTAYGGGGGGASTLPGRPGGSGGGGGNGGSGYSNQGGAVLDSTAECSPGGRSPSFTDAGGGGGATGPTPAGFFNLGATGLISDITGTSATYAVGGRGGYGSQGSANGVDAAANTGSGGSGMFDGYSIGGQTAGSGGSGIVILRYPRDYIIAKTGSLISSDATVGSDTVTTFLSGTGTITFS